MPQIITNTKPERLNFQRLIDVPRKEINWVWYPYIPRRAVTLIIGDGGYGKSWLTCALAADLSAGRPLPGQEAMPPKKVLMISAEDGIGEVIRPKMESLDADLEMIFAYDEGFILNPKKVQAIIDAIREFDVAVVFLDPLVVYMGGGVDINRANETRGVMGQLTEAAKETGVAIVVVHHVRKQEAAKLQHRTLGSVDLVNSVRSTLLVDISKTGQRYMAHVKHNWSEPGQTLAYSFDGKSFLWQGQYSGSIDDNQEVSLTRRGQAKAFLINTLRDGPVPAIDVIERAVADGMNETTLQRAKKGIAKSVQHLGKWVWMLEPELQEKISQEKRDLASDNTPLYPSPARDFGGNGVPTVGDSPAVDTGVASEELLRTFGQRDNPLQEKSPSQPPPSGVPDLDPAVFELAKARLMAKRVH